MKEVKTMMKILVLNIRIYWEISVNILTQNNDGTKIDKNS